MCAPNSARRCEKHGSFERFVRAYRSVRGMLTSGAGTTLMTLAAGNRLGGYEILAPLGAGPSTSREVAR